MEAIQEALQLLESVKPETQERDRLQDDRAQALLWLYICTLETKMQEVRGAAAATELVLGPVLISVFSSNQGIERDRRAQAPSNLEEFEVNDLNYEDKLQEDHFLYSHIAFNLAADAGEGGQHAVSSRPGLCGAVGRRGEEEGWHKGQNLLMEKAKFFPDGQVEKMVTFLWFTAQSKCLDQALALWKEVLTRGPAPAVRCLQQTAASLQILAALYQLAAKVMGLESLPQVTLEAHLPHL